MLRRFVAKSFRHERPVELLKGLAPCLAGARATRNMTFNYSIDAKTTGGEGYLAGPGKRFWFGEHYRTTWDKEVSVPYLDLDNTHGGLTIYKKGGGRQTTSLKFRSGNGSVWCAMSLLTTVPVYIGCPAMMK